MNEYPNNDYRDYIEHSAKGQKWKNHKYLYKTANGRYVYPEDVSDAKSRFNSNTKDGLTERFYSKANKATRAKNALASLRDRFSGAGSTSLSRPQATRHKRNVIRTVNPVGVGKRSAQYLESQRYNELNNAFTESKRKSKSGSRKSRNVTGTYRMPDKRRSSSSRKFTTRTSYSPFGRQLASRLIEKRDSNNYLDSVLGNARRASESRSYIDSVLRNAKYGDRPLKVVNRKGGSSSRKFSVGDYRYSSLGSQLARKLTEKRKTKKTMKNVYKTAKRMRGGHSRSRKF